MLADGDRRSSVLRWACDRRPRRHPARAPLGPRVRAAQRLGRWLRPRPRAGRLPGHRHDERGHRVVAGRPGRRRPGPRHACSSTSAGSCAPSTCPSPRDLESGAICVRRPAAPVRRDDRRPRRPRQDGRRGLRGPAGAAASRRGRWVGPTGPTSRPRWPAASAAYLIAPNLHPDEPAYVAEALAALRVRRRRPGRLPLGRVARTSPRCRTTSARRVSEDLVRRSGLAWTILQPGAYLQNLDLTGPRDRALRRRTAVFGFADLADVGEAAAVVLTEDGHVGATYELASRQATVAELAAEAGVVADPDRRAPGRLARRDVRLLRPTTGCRSAPGPSTGCSGRLARLPVMSLDETDLAHLRRCVELAREGLEDGDEPFGSLLVDAAGEVRFEDRNRRQGRRRDPAPGVRDRQLVRLAPDRRGAGGGHGLHLGRALPDVLGRARLDGSRPDRLRRLVGPARRVAVAGWGLPAGPGRRCRSRRSRPACPSTVRHPSSRTRCASCTGGWSAAHEGRSRRFEPVRVLLALGGNAMTNADGRARPEDQIAAAQVAMAAVAELLAHDVEVVITHGNGPQVGNLLVKNELAAAVVPPVPLDWCGAQTQATLGFVLMNALEAALAERGVDAAYGGAGDPRARRRRRPRLPEADQADRPVPPRRARRPCWSSTARRGRTAARRAGGASSPRPSRSRSSTRRPCRRWSRPGSSSSPTAAAGSRSSATPTARCAASRRSSTRTSAPRCSARTVDGRRARHRHRRPARRAALRHPRGRRRRHRRRVDQMRGLRRRGPLRQRLDGTQGRRRLPVRRAGRLAVRHHRPRPPHRRRSTATAAPSSRPIDVRTRKEGAPCPTPSKYARSRSTPSPTRASSRELIDDGVLARRPRRRDHRQDRGQRRRQRLHPDHRRPRVPRGAGRAKGAPADQVKQVPIVWSGGTDGVISPHATIFATVPPEDVTPDRRAAADRRLRDERAAAARGHRPHADDHQGRRRGEGRDGEGRHHRRRRRPLRADQDPAADHPHHPRRQVARQDGVDRGDAPVDGPLQRLHGARHRRRPRRDRDADRRRRDARPRRCSRRSPRARRASSSTRPRWSWSATPPASAAATGSATR